MENSKITYVAEIGSNHCGNKDLAMAHIAAAKEAGASGVKFQLFRAELLDSRPEIQQQLKPYELPLAWIPDLSAEAHRLGLTFGVTPFVIELVELLRGFVDWVKISAYDLPFDDLLSTCACLDVPVVLSTAMATVREIDHAITTVHAQRENTKIILLHGIAAYPARLEDMNLRRLEMLKSFWMDGVGLSDHTRGHEAAMLAMAYGATWIEKHFKMSSLETEEILGIRGHFQESPDYTTSADPWYFASLVGACERACLALGNEKQEGPLACELPLYQTARRSNTKRIRG